MLIIIHRLCAGHYHCCFSAWVSDCDRQLESSCFTFVWWSRLVVHLWRVVRTEGQTSHLLQREDMELETSELHWWVESKWLHVWQSLRATHYVAKTPSLTTITCCGCYVLCTLMHAVRLGNYGMYSEYDLWFNFTQVCVILINYLWIKYVSGLSYIIYHVGVVYVEEGNRGIEFHRFRPHIFFIFSQVLFSRVELNSIASLRNTQHITWPTYSTYTFSRQF